MTKCVAPESTKDESLNPYLNFVFVHIGEDEEIGLAFNENE